jgi:exocyst complex component 4
MPSNVCCSSFDGHDEEALDSNEEVTLDGNMSTMRINGSDVPKDPNITIRQMPTWLSNSTPDEFLVRAS